MPQYGNRFGGRGNFRGGRKPVDKTKVGLFRTKRRELLTGTAKDEALDKLVEVVREAKKTGRGVVFFCWANDYASENPKAPRFRVSFSVAEDQGPDGYEARPTRRSIEPDPADDLTPENDPPDDDPFK